MTNGDVKTFSFGGCTFERTSPPLDKLTSATRVLNVDLTLKEALMLNLAIDECIRQVNKYKQNKDSGKRATVSLTIHLAAERITVNESCLPKGMKRKADQ